MALPSLAKAIGLLLVFFTLTVPFAIVRILSLWQSAAEEASSKTRNLERRLRLAEQQLAEARRENRALKVNLGPSEESEAKGPRWAVSPDLNVKLAPSEKKAKNPGRPVVGGSGFRPLWVTVSAQPRWDLLGSFVAPILYLLAIANRYGYALEILPYVGSKSQKGLQHMFGMGERLKTEWGWEGNLQDANSRSDYDPAALNAVAFDELGFFPPQPEATAPPAMWIPVDMIPAPGPELDAVCANATSAPIGVGSGGVGGVGNGYVRCWLWMSPDLSKRGLQDTDQMTRHIMSHGGIDAFFTPEFRAAARAMYWKKNEGRLRHYPPAEGGGGGSAVSSGVKKRELTVAVHVRRGEISDPGRYILQETYAAVVRRICQERSGGRDREGEGDSAMDVHVHVFSSGPNPDGNWTALERVGSVGAAGPDRGEGVNHTGGGRKGAKGGPCSHVSFHLDEHEFDTWAHLVAADVLVISRSTFSYIPAMLSAGEVHFPYGFWHPRLKHWRRFRRNGEEVPV